MTARMRDGHGLWPVFITCLCNPCKDCRYLFLQGLCQTSFSLVYATYFCCSLCWKNLMYCQWHDDQLQSTNLRCRALKSTQVIRFFCQVYLLCTAEHGYPSVIALPCRRSKFIQPTSVLLQKQNCD